MTLPLDATTAILAIGLLATLVGALAGTAGYALLVRRGDRRLARLLERLTHAQDEGSLVALDAEQLRDPRLRESVAALADRVADTWRLATVDPLTGLASRQAIHGRVDDEIARAARYRRPLSVILADLDHFKRLNDSYGHAAGDQVLRHVGALLATSMRETDAAGRYGGEEFLVVLPETDADAAAAVAEKLRRIVAGAPVTLPDGTVVTVTLSAGVAGGLGGVLVSDALVRDADAALYAAKALGRDQVHVYREVGDDGAIRRAPIGIEAREQAEVVGRRAMAAAQAALLNDLAGRPGWAGAPSALMAEASVALGRAIDLPAGELDRIRVASLLHDLGNLAVPDEILAKPDDLAAAEWRVVSEHPKIGQVVLEQAGALRDAASIVLHHHEWFDGRGYPHGLAGHEIPVGARIVSIVDAYEAMVAGRPYRAAVSHDEALAELRRQAGAQFDPELVEIFADVFAAGLPWTPDAERLVLLGHPHPHDHAQPHDHAHPHAHPLAPAATARDAARPMAPARLTPVGPGLDRPTPGLDRPTLGPVAPRAACGPADLPDAAPEAHRTVA